MVNTTKEDIQKILYSFANNKISNTSVEHNILLSLLNHHPKCNEKVGVGVNYFSVQQSKWKFNQYNFMIHRIDGTVTDFSFHKCLNHGIKSSNSKNWGAIFRNAVKGQTDSFRIAAFKNVGSGDKFICSQTNLKFKKIYSHVDHVYPLTFDSIMLEFIKINEINLDEIKLSEDKCTSEVQEILDENIIKSFNEFHEKRSVLRIVCNSANLQGKKTKNYAGEEPIKVKDKLIKEYPQYHIKDTIRNL